MKNPYLEALKLKRAQARRRFVLAQNETDKQKWFRVSQSLLIQIYQELRRHGETLRNNNK